MQADRPNNLSVEAEGKAPAEAPTREHGLTRRSFVKILGAGLLVTVVPLPALGQRRGPRGEGQGLRVAARVHIAKDGAITVMTGKVEGGQGARAELTQAAAEELRVPVSRIQLVMGDTGLTPDDGITAGSRTTPSTVPAVRQGAAAARELLAQLAAQRWGVDRAAVDVRDGKAVHADSKRELTYADLAAADDAAKAFEQAIPQNVAVTPVKEWKVLGTSVPRPNRRDLVTGAHRFRSDIVRPGMLHGKVLRPPSYGAKLTAVDVAPAKAMKDVVVVQDGPFVGVAAPTTFAAEQALAAIAKTASWEPAPHPSSQEVFECGAILNPDNLLAQVQGCLLMGLGPALGEEIRFEKGRVLNASFAGYPVPRFQDVPELDLHLLDRPDLASAGGGETPIIAIAPAIAGAVFHATGERIRQMPIRLSKAPLP
jgi:isoquinoline 1-oxidoreductase